MDLSQLKKAYEILEKKYKLPSFKELNENFDIEKIKRGEETLARTIRKTMMEKVINSLGFMETLLNPVNAPRIYLIYIKSMTAEDKKNIDQIYTALSELVMNSMGLEIDYSEKDEAEMIKKIVKAWDSIKLPFRKIIANMKNPVTAVQKEKSYFG